QRPCLDIRETFRPILSLPRSVKARPVLRFSDGGFDHCSNLSRTIFHWLRSVCELTQWVVDGRMQGTICSTRCLAPTRGSITSGHSLFAPRSAFVQRRSRPQIDATCVLWSRG